ncbi:cleavage and polyadenylation specificity factor subunit [Entamoeba histolytica HM-3:IMSS]|uniref:Cleavage and polyadenylation specificity factor subunit, putative n=2 Tax=Entamoeba histolytica TaxID=5759 RepID=M2SEF1_ENTHI|nr:cleavage and polyadenylation specificity factor subunit, putative [Entamoeba histolytica KU27]EMS17753.1 cleavage and polyadenylation specificity factor subunit [Entamoeba histolytica HM-3:IMSS]
MTWLLHETVVNPQGVEHSIIAKFTGKYEQLITSIRNQFVCYDITPQGLQVRCKEVTEANIIQIGNVEVNHVMMLVLLFKEAKVSVLRYDETNNKFVIHSLHCFELPLKRMQEGLTPTTYTDPRLLIDKRGRCISLICYDRLMWVIPLGLDKTSYSINLEKFGINRIIDCIVLDGYDLPSVAFLHMKIPTWEGRIVNTGETTNEIIILSLEPDVIHERQDIVATISYQFSYVPYNALQIVDCYPTNGLLILTINSIIYLSTTSFESFILPFGKFFVIPKNINGPLSSFQILQMQTKIMNSVKSIFKLTNHLYIIFSMNGESYYVHLLSIANRICDVIITNSPYKYHPTTFTISSNHLFIGSTVHDSYIYNYEIVEYGKGKQHEISQHINQEIRSKNLLFRHNEMEEEYPFDEPQPVSIPQELTVEFPQLDYIVSILSYKNKLFVTVSFTTVLDTPDCPPQLPHSSNNQQEEPPVLEAQPLNSDVLLERYRIINLTTNDYYEFKKGQFICTAKLLKFKVGKQLKNYLVVGVNKQTTEDNPVKGKTYIFNIENQIQLINKIGDGKKSVHAVNEIGGFLAVASGNELELIERVDETRWIKKCFSDISILINSIEYLPLKVMERGNEKECYLILLSDFYRSVVLLLFKPYDYTVIPLGKDARNIHCIDSTFIITKDYFSVLEFDSEQNLSLLNYSSAATEQLSIFEIDATFNLGMNLLKFTRLWNGKGYIYMYVTVEGSVGYISVVEEKIYQVLRQINIKMNREPWHFAGTNAEEYRFEKGYGMGFGTRKHVFLDGDMLKQFRLLNEEQQKRVCLRNTSINDVFKLLSTGLQYNTFLQYNN